MNTTTEQAQSTRDAMLDYSRTMPVTNLRITRAIEAVRARLSACMAESLVAGVEQYGYGRIESLRDEMLITAHESSEMIARVMALAHARRSQLRDAAVRASGRAA